MPRKQVRDGDVSFVASVVVEEESPLQVLGGTQEVESLLQEGRGRVRREKGERLVARA